MSQSNYFIFNKSLAKNIGIEETYMLLTLIDANNIFKQKWFFQTAEMLEELTGLKKDKQKRIIDCLVNLNIIEQKNIGIPCKRHFKINYEELEKLLIDFSKLEEVKTLQSLFTWIFYLFIDLFEERMRISQASILIHLDFLSI